MTHAKPEPAAAPPGPRFRGPSPRGSYLLVIVGVGLAVALGFLVSSRVGALMIGATLLVAGVWRAAKPRTPFAAGLAVRSKGLDLAWYFGGAAIIIFLGLTVPYLG